MNKIPRREFLKASGAVGAGLAVWPLVSQAAPGGSKLVRPNILVFLTDEHGQWAQHAYGNSELKTPNMDQDLGAKLSPSSPRIGAKIPG